MDTTESSDLLLRAPTPLPVGIVPTPTRAYRERRKLRAATIEPGQPKPALIPLPLPIAKGSRVLIWKQDPTVGEIGIRKSYLPGTVLAGPRDGRLTIQGLTPVTPNAMGDLIEAPGTDAFDAVHTFAVVRETLTMYQRALSPAAPAPMRALPWQWNTGGNVDPISVHPHAGVTMNAFYSRTARALKFFFFQKPGAPAGTFAFTCRSFDIVSHETGHAVLDGLKSGWLESSAAQTGALHESFGDLTAIFLALAQFDQVESFVSQTKANLHAKTFLSDLAEEFGLALGRPNGLRNADNDLKLSQVGNEVHDLSQVFTGGIYDVLADLFALERQPGRRDDAIVLYEVARYVQSLLLRGIIAAPATNALFADVVNAMLTIAAADGKPVQYRNALRNRFTIREVVVSPTPLSRDHEEGQSLAPTEHISRTGHQNRSGCCGTMQLHEYNATDELMNEELAALRAATNGGAKDAGAGRRRAS